MRVAKAFPADVRGAIKEAARIICERIEGRPLYDHPLELYVDVRGGCPAEVLDADIDLLVVAAYQLGTHEVTQGMFPLHALASYAQGRRDTL